MSEKNSSKGSERANGKDTGKAGEVGSEAGRAQAGGKVSAVEKDRPVTEAGVDRRKPASRASDTAAKAGTKKPARPGDKETPPAGKPAARGGRGLAWLALLLVLVLAGLGEWRAIQQAEALKVAAADSRNQVDRLQAEIENLQASIKQMGGQIVGEDIIQPKLDKMTARVDSLVALVQRQADDGEALKSRLTALEQAVTGLDDRQQITENSLAGLNLGRQATDRDVILAEVGFLVRAAAQRLALFDDAAAASRFLQLADRQLASLDANLYAPVRHRIQEDLLAIKSVQVADVVAITGKLLALEQSVDGWRTHLPERAVDADGESADNESGLREKLDYLFRSLVTVREDQGDKDFLTLAQADRIKDRIRLELQAARSAVLAGYPQRYQASLGRVSNWLREYFDPAEASNAAALRELESLLAVNLQIEWPDMNPLLALIRQLQPVVSEPQATTPVAEQQP